jgi:glutaminyl-peptide cyclotransferase
MNLMRTKPVWALLAGAITIAIFVAIGRSPSEEHGPGDGAAAWVAPPPFNSQRAFDYLLAICDLGPRPSGSRGMAQMQQIVTGHCEKFGAQVERQTFMARHPNDGSPVEMTNLIVRWNPEQKERVLLCAHYDTRPFPDQDPVNPRGVFIGANDGGSGVALLMEMAHAFSKEKFNVGVDFVLFDGEEFLFDPQRDRDLYFLGSTHFAQQIAAGTYPTRYRCGILVDMIADKNLDLYYEANSMRYAKELCIEVWKVAERLKIKEFRPRVRHDIRDDHMPMNSIARVPTIDIIDFDYPAPGSRVSFWHTEQDVPANCSGESICKVASVLLEWLRQQR